MPATPQQYHVVLDGQGYLIDPATYRRRPAARFAPKTRTGDEAYGDFVNGSAWSQSNWQEGVVAYVSDEWDAQHPSRAADASMVDGSMGDLRLGRSLERVLNDIAIYGMATWRGKLYGIGENDGQVWVSATGDPGTFTVSADLNTISPVTRLRSVLAVGTALYPGPGLLVGAGDSGKLFYYDGTAWGLYHTLASVTAIRSLCEGPYAGSPNQKWVLLGASAPPPGGGAQAGVYVLQMPPTMPALIHQVAQAHVDAMFHFGDFFYFAALDEILVGGLTAGVNGVLYYSRSNNTGDNHVIATQSDNGISCFLPYGDDFVAGSRFRGMLFKITPNSVNGLVRFPYVAYPHAYPYASPIRGLAIHNGRLYAPARDETGLCVYQWDGVGWIRFAAPASAFFGEPRGVIAFNNYLFAYSQNGIFRMSENYAPSGWWITPWFDADLATLDKGFARFSLTYAPLNTGESIKVEYGIDDVAGWTLLGTASTVGAAVSVFTFPLGVHGRRIRFRYTLSATTLSETPKLRTTVLEYQITADLVAGTPAAEPPIDAHVKGEFAFEVMLEGTFEHPLVRLDRSVEPKNGDQLRRALWASKAKQSALSYEDTDGQVYSVWFADLEDRLSREHSITQQGWRGTVRLTEE